MARFTCTLVFALDIAKRLGEANVPFTLDCPNAQACVVTCKFDDTLQCVVDQLNGRHIPISRLTIDDYPDRGLINGPRQSSSHHQLQQIPKKYFIDLPSGTEEVFPSFNDVFGGKS